MSLKVNVRFAPSPTGALHIGGLRTVLYNYLLAKKHHGSFILRIEDTDQKRLVKSAEAYILASLRWLNIVPDQGPEQSGPFAPYRQSERTAIYQQYIKLLLEEGHAYYAFDTPEELENMRKSKQTAYNATSRAWMKNSIVFPKEQTEAWLQSGKPYAIRLKVPHREEVRFYDQVRGWVNIDTSVLDDKILIKADGKPTYHFANVVDDHLMQITHVIRGEEWLPSTPVHILLYRYLGWGDDIPHFVHLPLLLAPDGQGKLSKRHTKLYNIPVFPISWHEPELEITESFQEQGYLPEALENFLALLGWNPATGQEIFSRQELIDAFSLEDLGKSGVICNIDKAKWLNQQHIRRQEPKMWVNYMMQGANKENITIDENLALDICMLVQDRVVFTQDFWKEGRIFFIEPTCWDTSFVEKKWNSQAQELLILSCEQLKKLDLWRYDTIKQSICQIMEKSNQSMHAIMPPLRIAITGQKSGPDLISTMAILGRKRSIQRIDTFLEKHPIKPL